MTLEERLAALGAAFRDRLGQDASRLRALARELDGTPGERARALGDIRALSHKLAGTAPAFEATDIGSAAHDVELAALAAEQQAEAASPGMRERVASLCTLLDTATGAAGGTPRVFRPRI
jgi:hypothetical protein